jgi:hypothetical protein
LEIRDDVISSIQNQLKEATKKPGLLSSVVFKSKDLEMNIERLAFESEAYFLAPPQGEE